VRATTTDRKERKMSDDLDKAAKLLLTFYFVGYLAFWSYGVARVYDFQQDIMLAIAASVFLLAGAFLWPLVVLVVAWLHFFF